MDSTSSGHAAPKSKNPTSRGHAVPKQARIARDRGRGYEIHAFQASRRRGRGRKDRPRAQRASGRSAGEKKKPPRKPYGGNPESILFYLSYYPILYAGFGRKTVFGHSARVPSREGAKEPQRSAAVFPPTRNVAGKGAQKAQPRPFATPMHQKKERPFSGAFLFLFLLFSALRARLLHSLIARAPFLPSGARRKFSSFRTARREFFFLSGGLAGVFLPYSGFLSIAA